MNIKTPTFWYVPWERTPHWLRFVAPIGHIYGWVTALRLRFITPVNVGIPVICVGNLVAGGSGKTPTALSLLSLIKSSGIAKNPCFLTRGYGGSLEGPVFVSQHSYKDVGDEALLLAQVAPTIVAHDRVAGARTAVAGGHDMIIMDDGFQNPSLHKDISFIVVDGQAGFGNGFLIPCGPLREPIVKGLKRAQALIKIGDGPFIHTSKTVIDSHFEITAPLTTGERVYGFCGLGQPEKFRKTLLNLGVELAGFESFPDHHPYSHADIQTLHAKAFEHKARLVTTEKDLCRLPSAENILIVKVKLVFAEPEKILSLIRQPA